MLTVKCHAAHITHEGCVGSAMHRPTQRDINTPTHTIFADRLTAVPSFTAEINKSHMGRSCMTSTTGRVEPMTMSCNDPRYLRVEAPYGPIPLGKQCMASKRCCQ